MEKEALQSVDQNGHIQANLCFKLVRLTEPVEANHCLPGTTNVELLIIGSARSANYKWLRQIAVKTVLVHRTAIVQRQVALTLACAEDATATVLVAWMQTCIQFADLLGNYAAMCLVTCSSLLSTVCLQSQLILCCSYV